MIDDFFNVSYSPFIHENRLRQLLDFNCIFDDKQRYVDVMNFCDKLNFSCNNSVVDLGSNIGTYALAISKYHTISASIGVDRDNRMINISNQLSKALDLTHIVKFIHSDINASVFAKIYRLIKYKKIKILLMMGLGQIYKDVKLRLYLTYGILCLKPEFIIASIEPEWLMRRNYLYYLFNIVGNKYSVAYKTDLIIVFACNEK